MSARFPGFATTCDASSWVRISTEGTDSSTSWPTICRRLAAARPTAMFAISATASRSISEISITCPATSLRDLPEPQISPGQEGRKRLVGQRLGDESRAQLADARDDLFLDIG